MNISTWLRWGLALAAGTSATTAFAHDFFLLPERFTAAATGEIGVKATVSGSFPQLGTAVPADRVARLHAQGEAGPRLTVAGAGTDALNLVLSAPRSGLIVAGVSALPRDVDYAEDRIGIILEEYRIEGAAAEAVTRLPQPRTFRVSSRRFAKTIICAVRCTDRSAAGRPLGADLEFVGVGGSADHFLLLSRGTPLRNHPVDVVTSDGRRRHVRTDGEGQIHLPEDARGTLMLFGAQLEPPADGDRFTLNLSSITLSR